VKKAQCLTVTNSTLSGNTATDSLMGDPGQGGGIRNGGGLLWLQNSTIGGNSAGDGGGIYGYGTSNVTNSVLGSNTGGECSGTITSHDYNVASDDTCGLSQPHDQPHTDPLLGPLADNGGPTWTHALQRGSPAIDAGDCSGGALGQDQRGMARPQGAACDAGAYEAGVWARDDDYVTQEDTVLVVAAPGVLANDWALEPVDFKEY
jgi:hypothetical protein